MSFLDGRVKQMDPKQPEENKRSGFYFGEESVAFLKEQTAKPKEPTESLPKISKDDFIVPVDKPHSKVYHPKKPWLHEVFEWLDVVVASIIAVVIIFTFVFRIVAIDGPSMMNTLLDGERVIISNLFYEPKRGDIVVISRNTDNSTEVGSYDEPIIKRIIATEGELVDIDFEAGIVYVDGVALEEEYTLEPTYRSFDITFPVRVKDDCVFVLGDNRNDSMDSRSSQIGENGMIHEKYILGHAICRVFPLNKIGRLK